MNTYVTSLGLVDFRLYYNRSIFNWGKLESVWMLAVFFLFGELKQKKQAYYFRWRLIYKIPWNVF